MKKGQICEGYVEQLDFPNKGVLSCEDEKVVVKNVLPGQKISFMITKNERVKQKDVYWMFWKMHLMKFQVSVLILVYVAVVHTRPYLMINS